MLYQGEATKLEGGTPCLKNKVEINMRMIEFIMGWWLQDSTWQRG